MFRLISLLALGATAVSAEKKLCAKFDYDDLKAMVVVKQSDSECALNVARWEVEFSEFNDDLCPGGLLNWHVHQYAGDGIRNVGDEGNAPACNADVTGGHFDPTFACGSASHNVGNNVCTILRNSFQTPINSGYGRVLGPDYKCSTTDQSYCEIGDQSGKLGKLTATVPSSSRRLKKGKKSKNQKFDDNWITPITNLENRSLVLHCCKDDDCGARLACATLEEVV